MTDKLYTLLPEEIRAYYEGRHGGLRVDKSTLSVLAWEENHIIIRHNSGFRQHWYCEEFLGWHMRPS